MTVPILGMIVGFLGVVVSIVGENYSAAVLAFSSFAWAS